ncbi:hypothetical protein [Priestia megaterium]|uniref:hypothetical protein n=1 Tax=Priestia megaterium TaxID=1404 RepID=UPI0015D4B9E8|nr:hypothetical protein [Priestia megaterium]
MTLSLICGTLSVFITFLTVLIVGVHMTRDTIKESIFTLGIGLSISCLLLIISQ